MAGGTAVGISGGAISPVQGGENYCLIDKRFGLGLKAPCMTAHTQCYSAIVAAIDQNSTGPL